MAYTPIQCQLYDYIEIACLRHYTLMITLLEGGEIQGKADTTKIEDKQEFLILDAESQDEKTSIRLDKIKSITALDENAEFSTVKIN